MQHQYQSMYFGRSNTFLISDLMNLILMSGEKNALLVNDKLVEEINGMWNHGEHHADTRNHTVVGCEIFCGLSLALTSTESKANLFTWENLTELLGTKILIH